MWTQHSFPSCLAQGQLPLCVCVTGLATLIQHKYTACSLTHVITERRSARGMGRRTDSWRRWNYVMGVIFVLFYEIPTQLATPADAVTRLRQIQ